MDKFKYHYVSVHANDLDDMLLELSEQQVRIVAASQTGNVYTIFYQRCESGAGCEPMEDLYDEEGGEILRGQNGR